MSLNKIIYYFTFTEKFTFTVQYLSIYVVHFGYHLNQLLSLLDISPNTRQVHYIQTLSRMVCASPLLPSTCQLISHT